jgi:integrase
MAKANSKAKGKRGRAGSWYLDERPRKDGTTSYRWRYYDDEGNRPSSPTFESVEAANEWRAGVLALGKPAAAGTFEQASESWLKACAASPSTVHDYRQCLRGHLVPAFGDKRLGAITVDDLNAYLEAKQEGTLPVPEGFRRSLKTPTLRRHMWIVRGVFDHAIYANKHRGNNPANGKLRVSPKGRTARAEPPSLRLDNQRLLWAEVPGDWKPLTSVLLYLGLRYGEASGLRWRNWLPDQGEEGLIVVAGAIKKGGKWGTGKTDNAYRRLAVPPLVRELLDWQRERVENDLMFPGIKGGLCSNSYYNQKVLKPAARRAGIEREIGAHVLRHSFALNQINAGVQPSRLAKLMGHSSPSFTLARYGRWWERDYEPVAMPEYEEDDAAPEIGSGVMGPPLEWVPS